MQDVILDPEQFQLLGKSPFVLKQPYLLVRSPTVACRVTILPNDAMARNEHSDWILAIRQADSANAVDVTDTNGQLKI